MAKGKKISRFDFRKCRFTAFSNCNLELLLELLLRKDSENGFRLQTYFSLLFTIRRQTVKITRI